MTEKELRKLSRYQLLDLLVTQTERADELQKKLENEFVLRDFNMSQLGSLAEASLQISGVVDAAQEAADMYLNAAQKQADLILAYARRQAASIIVKAEMQARNIAARQQESGDEAEGAQEAE